MSEHEDFNSDPRDKECSPPEVPEIAYSDLGSKNEVGDFVDQHLQSVGPDTPANQNGKGIMEDLDHSREPLDVDAIVDRLLSYGQEQDRRYAERDLLPAAGLPPSTTEWLWEGYIMRGKVTNVEAKGGSGKSRLILGIAAGLSLGVWPFTSDSATSITCKPGKTLILTSEDTPEEITDTFKEAGGDVSKLFFYNPRIPGALVLDEKGIDRLQELVAMNNFDMVVLDPVLEFVPKTLTSQNDNTAITKFLASLRHVATMTGCAIVCVRHFSKGMAGKEVHEMAAGGEAWRNGARGQFVLFAHPECRKGWTQVMAVPARDTMRAQYGKPFGIEITEGRQTFVPPHVLNVETYCEAYEALAKRFGRASARIPDKSRGPKATRLNECVEALAGILEKSPGRAKHYEEIRSELIGAGFPRALVYRAKAAMKDAGILRDSGTDWVLTDDYDPFADDVIPENPSGNDTQSSFNHYWQDKD